MKLILCLLFIIDLCSSLPSQAQSSFWQSDRAYLGQHTPDTKPQIFAADLLADSDAVTMDRVAFSADGKEFYYCQAPHWFTTKGVKVKYFTFTDNAWRGPFVLNTGVYGPTFSLDDQCLYFLGGKGKVWQSRRTTTGWSETTLFLSKHYGLYDYMPTQSGTTYVGSNGKQGNVSDFSTYDFSQFRTTPTDTTIESLGLPLNTAGFDGDFFVAPDESFMIISAKETKDYESELYISYRKTDQTWTNPKSLGPLINNGIAHRWGQYVTPDGRYLFYTQGTSEKDCHIYWLRFDGLRQQLRHTNFAPYLKTPIGNQTATVGKPISLKIPAGTFVDDDGPATLRYAISQSAGEPLLKGLRYNSTTSTLSGRPARKGHYKLIMTATDTVNEQASCAFTLTIE